MPKADEENNNEEDENDNYQQGRRPGKQVSVWSSDQTGIAGNVLSERNPSFEEPTPKFRQILKRKGDALAVGDQATTFGDHQVELTSDCRKYGGEAKKRCALADPKVHEAQLQKNDNVKIDYENNSSQTPNNLREPKHVEKEGQNAEHDIEKLVEFYADEATQQTLDVKKVILASNMDVRVVVTNIVEEMEDQLVGRKAVEQQEQGKGMRAESIALSGSQTLLVDSMPKERGVNQEEIEFIKELVEQLDREEKEDRIAHPDRQDEVIQLLDLADTSYEVLADTSKDALMTGSKKQATEKCTLCKERFTGDSFRRHQMLPHDFQCNVEGCDSACVDSLTLRKHKKEVHFIGCLQQDIQYKCEACGEVMAPGPQFTKHIETAHRFACDYCDLKYVEEDKLRKHEKNHHRGKEKRKSSDLQLEKIKEETINKQYTLFKSKKV